MNVMEKERFRYAIEVRYPNSGRIYCDFVFEDGNNQNWMELKALCTNRRKKAPTVESLDPVTTPFVSLNLNRVKEDIIRLSNLTIPGPKWSLLFVYPHSQSSDDQIGSLQSEFGSKVGEHYQRRLERDGLSLSLYLVRIK